MICLIRLAVPLLAVAIAATADEAPAPADEAGLTQSTFPASDPVLAAARAADHAYLRRVELLVGDLDDQDIAKRISAIRAIGRLQDPLALAHVIPFLDPVDRSDDELVAAITAIRDSGAPGLSSVLQRLIGHGSDDVRLAAHHALDRLAALNVADHKALAGDSIDAVRANAVSSLGLMKHTEAAPILIDALRHDERAHVRRLAAIALGRFGDKANAPVLIESLTDSNRGVRRYAAEALAQLDYKPAIPYLLMALEANVAGAYIDRSVEVLSGQDFGYDSRANGLDRAAAMDRGFAWYALHSKEFEAQ